MSMLSRVVPSCPELSYNYDALNNLSSVAQGSQGRSFSYDSLSRLSSATNPESGATSYTYDNDGNVKTKKDARGITTTLSYDPLNRVLSKTYSDGTPAVSYTYDGPSPGKGKLASVAVTNSSNTFQASTAYSQYDPEGNVLSSSENITAAGSSGQYNFVYTYNLAGGLTSETYPSLRKILTSYDLANRPTTVTGQLGSQTIDTAYASAATYAAQGAVSSFVFPNGLNVVNRFNFRLQPCSVEHQFLPGTQAQTLLEEDVYRDSSYSQTFTPCSYQGVTINNNNGTVLGINNWSGGTAGNAGFLTFRQAFAYDRANRLSTASEQNATVTPPSADWSRTFNYDGYGNMWVTNAAGITPPGNTPTAQSNFVASNNHLSNFGYDAAGNQTSNAGYTVSYDAENRQTSVQAGSSPIGAYGYDGNGNRVLRTASGVTTFYTYDVFGQLAAEYSTALANPPCRTCYLSRDHLGTIRVVTDEVGNVVARHDYLPFGEEIASGVPGGTTGRTDPTWDAADNINQKFTGKERDSESALDYFGARYYGSALGRFTSPDDPLVDQHASDPQSWNLYSYVRNNPLKDTDPNGLDCITISNQTSSGVEVTTERGGSADTCSGTYVNGTVDVNSYSYNGGSLGYSFSNDTSAGAGTISFGSSQSDDEWGPGSSNMLGVAQIGRTATVGNILGGALIGGGVVAGGGIAYGAWAGGSALTALTIPAATLPPAVSNPTLQSIVQKLFQETDVLPDGTAGAVRYELATGELMSPSGHSMKAQEVITALTNLLKTGKLSFNDQIVSRQLIQDLSDALKTQPRK